jgi:hypothetical protein
MNDFKEIEKWKNSKSFTNMHSLKIKTYWFLSFKDEIWSAVVLQIFNAVQMKGCMLTVIRFLGVSAKFSTCTVVSVNGILFEAEMCTFTLESTHFVFNKCLIYNHDGASAKFSTNSHETDYSAVGC